MSINDQITKAADAILKAESILIGTGAGMGVDSGLPDFRGNKGFWKAYPALHGIAFEDMANPEWFDKDPYRAWGFYGHRLNLYRETIPHEGFHILKRWVDERSGFIYTSNVDGQFQKAGFSRDNIVECHGSIHWVQYAHPDVNHGRRSGIWSAEGIEVDVDETELKAVGRIPRKNGMVLRPNILMFGDWAWDSGRTEQQIDRYYEWIESQNLQRTVVIEIGAGTAIPTVRGESRRMERRGATLIRINPRESQGSPHAISIPLGGLDALTRIEKCMREGQNRDKALELERETM